MQQFDAASVQALLQALTQRAVAGQFLLTVGTTRTLAALVHPFVRMRPRGAPPWTTVQWQAVYRSPSYQQPVVGVTNGVGQVVQQYETIAGVERTFGLVSVGQVTNLPDPAERVVVDASDSLVAQGLMLLWAQTCFDSHDMRMKQAGRAPGRFP